MNSTSTQNIKVLTEYEAKNLLRKYDINCPQESLIEVRNPGEFSKEKFLDRIEKQKNIPSLPFYLKICSRDILHKTEAGGIKRVDQKVEIGGAAEDIIKKTLKYNHEARIQGIIVSEDVSNEHARELILGATYDNQFGHIISLGIGGISVEIYEDLEMRAVPLSEKDVHGMIENLRGKKILSEFRGKKPIEKDLLISTTLKFSRMIEENPEIQEMDINPLMADPTNIVAADALVKIKGNSKKIREAIK